MKLDALIHVGSSRFRLLIVEFAQNGEYRIIDSSERMIPLGKNVFTSGQISPKTINISIDVLKHFREQLKGWKIVPENVKVVATSALREAKNRDTFVNRIEVRTGFRINIIEGVEEIRLSYLAVQYAISGMHSKFNSGNSLIIEVGGGSTEVILLRRGSIVTIHSLSIGAVRVEQQLLNTSGQSDNLETFLSQDIQPFLERLDSEMKLSSVKNIVAIGGYAKTASEYIKTNNDRYTICSNKEFHTSCDKMISNSESHEDGFRAAVQILKQFLDAAQNSDVIIPRISVDEGYFLEEKGLVNSKLQERYSRQVVAGAITLAKKYNTDMVHSMHVTKLALSMFDQLQDEHRLTSRERLLLEVGSILHDIGTFVKASGHHKHGLYIVENSEIFGLGDRDLKIVANLVRYHRKSTPRDSHLNYKELNREEKLLVLKLAGILRIADALDRGHSKRIEELSIEKSSDRMIIHATYHGDISVERFSMKNKSAMFQDVYGLKVQLR